MNFFQLTKNSTVSLRRLFSSFKFLRRHAPSFLNRLWGKEDEFAWQRMTMLWLKGRNALVNNRFGQIMSVRLDSLGDLYAAFGRKEEKNIPEILCALPSGGVVLDIGAHIGGFSLIAARAVGPSGRVHAFEPVSSNAILLEQNAGLNQMDWLKAVHAAVGRKAGFIELHISDTDTMWASTRVTWANVLHHGMTSAHTISQSVPVITVDHFLRKEGIQNVALMKIDVEAAELDVLAGAGASLAAGYIRQIIVEVHGPTVKWGDVKAILNHYGYEVRDLDGAEMHATLRPQAQRMRNVSRHVSVALIGCGAVSEILYANALDKLASEGVIETVALADPNPARAVKIGKTFPTARQYRSLNQMLTEVIPDLVIIAAPHQCHADMAVTCFKRGIHVLCEKPMAVTTADCDRMIAAADKAGSLLAVGHFRRFFPSCQVIKDILAAGLLGPVRSFRFLEGETYSWPAQSISFFKRAEAGGGVLIDAGAHTIDLLLWWMGEVAEVEYQDDAMGGVEANCRISLKMTNGAEGMVQLSRDWPLPNYYIIECEKGWIKYECDIVDTVEWGIYGSNYGLNTQVHMIAESTAGVKTQKLGAAVPGFMECFESQLRNVIAAIHGKEPLRVSGQDARNSVALIEKCYLNRKLLDMRWLDKMELQRVKELANV